ncbi:MAG: Mur ligase, partial [Kiritimatiellae bacterium]|nr:Mur ligase [Kiritimatiellia bacterium]
MAIQTDSRLVKPGDTFVAVKGAATDGARFVPAALAAGAARVVSEDPPPPDLPAGVSWERIPDSRAAAAALACEDAGHP